MVQRAYSFLSNDRKPATSDAGIFDPLNDNKEDLGEFIKKFRSAIERVKSELVKSSKDIQQMFDDLVSKMAMDFGGSRFSRLLKPAKMTCGDNGYGLICSL